MKAIKPYLAIELALNASGEVRGRTALQKLVYLVSQKLKTDGIFYESHHYGPYSWGVADDLATLCDIEFINEVEVKSGNAVTYTYNITEKAKPIAEKRARDNREAYEIIEDVIKICKSRCGLDIKKLSHAAKTHYLTIEHGISKSNSFYDEVVEKAKWHGWKMSKQEVLDAETLLQELKLDQ